MTRDQAAPIALSAAASARAMALGFVRMPSGRDADEQSERLADWCWETARPLVRGIVVPHEVRHQDFKQMHRKARSS